MELYGSLLNISGSVTASAFTGSFIGDGSGLSGIQASGVTGLNLSQISSGNATASISSTGFKVNKNTQIEGNLSVTGALIATEYIVSSSVTYMTTSFASGSSAFGNDDNDIHQFTGSVQITGSISLNGQAIGTGKLDETTFQSYTSSNNSRVSALETSSGSLNSFTSSIITTIKSKLDSDNVISGSVQVNITETTGYNTFSSSISNSIDNLSSSVAITTSGLTSTITILSSSLTSSIGNLSSSIATIYSNQEGRLNALETSSGSLNSFTSSIDTTIKSKLNSDGVISGSSQILNDSNIVSSSAQVTAYGFATTGSNLFIGAQTHSGSILPSVDNTYDLGSAEYQWRDVYISSGSLYIDGTKVLSSTTQELTITTDNGQSLKILEGTTDSIVIQTADGDIELKSSADGDILLDPTNGKIMLKGPIEVLSGQKIQSSVGGTPVVFANDIVVSGSIDITGTIEGIDLTTFSSSINNRLNNLETSSGSLNVFTSSIAERVTLIETSTASLNNFTSSINTTIKSKLDNDGVISGSSQIIISGTTGYSSFSSSISTTINDLSSSMIGLSSSFSSTDSDHEGRLNVIESRYTTTGSNVFIGDQTITGSLYISQNLVVQGESSVENITASAVSIGTNTIILNSDSPAVRYAGISVFDSGSTNITASLFYDSLTNNWKFKHSDVGTDDASILLYGPLGTGIDNAPTLDANYLTKVEDNGHGHHLTTSSVFDNGSKISLKNNTEVTGSLIVTSTIISQGTTLVSGSEQISYAGITNIPSGIISGSAQVVSSLPEGTVSGSSQVLNGSGVWSGSAQLPSGIVSGSSQITFGSISSIPSGLVSGSSQITFGSISSIPSGLVSGSSQIDLTATTNYSTGIKTRLNAEGVISGSAQVVAVLPTGTVSGSAQISFGSISGLPSGLVSGSSQITLSSTSGFGSYLNQAVLTTSSPTFSSVSATTFTGALSGNASTASTVSLSSGTAVNHTGTGTVYLGKWTGGSTPVPFSISASGSTISNDATYGTLLIDRSNINANGAGSNFHFTILGTEYGGMGVTAETGVSSGSVVGKMRWYLTAAGTSRQERMTLDTSGTLILYPSGNSGLLGLGDTGAGIYRDNTYDVVVHQSNSSGSSLYLSGAGNVVVSLDNNNNETDRKFIVGSNAVKASNELFSVNESGNGYFSGTLSSGAISISAGGDYPVVATSTQRYFYQARNTNNSVNSSYGWWWFMDTNFNMGFHADGAADRLTLTRDGNLTITGGITTAANTLNLLGSQIYVSPTNSNTLNSGYGVNGSADIWINYRGYNDGQTQYRNFNIGDGRGNNVLWAEGSSSKVVINNSQSAPTDAKLQVNGNIDILDVTNGVFRIYNNTTFRGGLGTDAWAHAGSAANMTLFATGVLHFTSGGTKRAYFDGSGHLLPQVNNTYNLGSSSLGWANVYTNDLHLSNMNKPEGNDIDGTSGNWTIQEGAENLYIINNNNGKKFKISLEEII